MARLRETTMALLAGAAILSYLIALYASSDGTGHDGPSSRADPEGHSRESPPTVVPRTDRESR